MQNRKKIIFSVVLFLGFFGFVENSRATLLFFDDFEYAVNRDSLNAISIFQQEGGWAWAKTRQDANYLGRGNGYLYTTSTVPGYNGPLPGQNSSRVLSMEALPATYGGQTDFYLQYGSAENPANENLIPADVWFQFWLYTNHYGSQLTQVTNRDKFIYPCNASYPCPGTGEYHKWLFSLNSLSGNPLNQEPYGNPSAGGEAFLFLRPPGANYSLAPSWDADKLGQFRTDEYLVPNRWNLVKLHFDTSSVASGKWEAWIKPLGGEFTKVVEWIGGVTPNFTWTPSPGGHRVFRMPTTIGNATTGGPDEYFYMDDFAMANSESSLPVYGAGGSDTTSPAAPGGLVIQ